MNKYMFLTNFHHKQSMWVEWGLMRLFSCSTQPITRLNIIHLSPRFTSALKTHLLLQTKITSNNTHPIDCTLKHLECMPSKWLCDIIVLSLYSSVTNCNFNKLMTNPLKIAYRNLQNQVQVIYRTGDMCWTCCNIFSISNLLLYAWIAVIHT